MQKEILEQRGLIEQLIELVHKIKELDGKIIDPHNKLDMILMMSVHKHSFEEQQVADHSQCKSFFSVGGDEFSLIGLLGYHCSKSFMFKSLLMRLMSDIAEHDLELLKNGDIKSVYNEE